MTKLKQQADDLAAKAASDAEEAAQTRAQAEREYNSIAAELDTERQQVCWGHIICGSGSLAECIQHGLPFWLCLTCMYCSL